VQFWVGGQFYRAPGGVAPRLHEHNTLVAMGTSAAYIYRRSGSSSLAFMHQGLGMPRYFDSACTVIT
jgi:cation transport ATPase